MTIGQIDTLNRYDDQNIKQGYWIHYGKDRPELNYPANGKIEEGRFLNDRKEGFWTKYYSDGQTPKIRFNYVNNRPFGEFEKYFPNGNLKEKGNIQYNKYVEERFLYYESGGLEQRTVFGNQTDSSYYYTNSGCLNVLEVFIKADPKKIIRKNFYIDSCNILKDSVVIFVDKVTPCDWGTGEFQYEPTKSASDSFNKLDSISCRFKVNSSLYSDENICSNSEKEIRKTNELGELIFVGTCKNGKVLNGRFYFYDHDGILLRVENWEDGEFKSIGGL